ncbi:hypothetical protein Q3G72_007487 [Acer saccharum]|nr:hypothetical protein Q3G72_007487 [Acer saccharum]
MSSFHASEQQRTNDAGPSSVPVALSNVHAAAAPIRRTRLRFVSSTQMDSAAIHGTKTSHQDTATLPRMDAVPPPQQDIITGASDVGV